jgi:SAM-dependent methyltransferase
MPAHAPTLQLLPLKDYPPPRATDPLKWYYWPVLGTMYRRRVELCLAECTGGSRILEVGFGSGVTFLNLHALYDEIHGIDLDGDVEEVTNRFRARGIETHLRNGNVLFLPYPDGYFDTVLLISILEHLKPEEQPTACREIMRVLRPGGQLVYGVPIERKFMASMFRLLGSGADIHDQHLSTHEDVARGAASVARQVRIVRMKSVPSVFGDVYEVGHFVKE